MEEEETPESSGVTDSGKEASTSRNSSVRNWRYREIASNDSNEGTISTFPSKSFYLVKFVYLFTLLIVNPRYL